MDIAIARWLSIYANPSYIVPLKSVEKRSEVLQLMLNETPSLEKYISGFNISVGLSFNLNMDL